MAANMIAEKNLGQISNADGAHALHISVRQFRRLKARYQQRGVRGLVHGLRGRPSPRAAASTSSTWSRVTTTPVRSR